MTCNGSVHNLDEVFSTDNIYTSTMVRWCVDCGAVVIDSDWDNRTQPGDIMPMRFPTMTYPNQRKK